MQPKVGLLNGDLSLHSHRSIRGLICWDHVMKGERNDHHHKGRWWNLVSSDRCFLQQIGQFDFSDTKKFIILQRTFWDTESIFWEGMFTKMFVSIRREGGIRSIGGGLKLVGAGHFCFVEICG